MPPTRGVSPEGDARCEGSPAGRFTDLHGVFDVKERSEEQLSSVGPQRPASGQVVVFPVQGAQRVISVVYADNGERPEPVEDIEILELATSQVGIAFENELLRRELASKRS